MPVMKKNLTIISTILTLTLFFGACTTGQPELPQVDYDQSTISIDTNSYHFEALESGQTALELFDRHLELEYTEYDFGVFITSVNGLESTDSYYWAIYLNQEYAQQGADQLLLEPGDSVSIVYEEISLDF